MDMGDYRSSEDAHTEGRRTPDSWVESEPRDSSDTSAAKHESTPLPYASIIALCLGRVAEGMMFSVILPYINEMVHGMGVAEDDVGKWSAAAEAVHFVTATISGPIFGYLGDRYGRRPVYLLSLLGWVFGVIAFGLMKTLAGVIIGRALRVLSRTIMGGITDKSNSVKAFAIFSPAVVIGTTVGPVVGGLFATPVPDLFSPRWTLFVDYPYLLPAVVTSGFSVVVVSLAARYIPETRDKRIAASSASDLFETEETGIPLLARENYRETSKDSTGASRVPDPQIDRVKKLLSHGPFRLLLLLFIIESQTAMAIGVSFPLFAYTPQSLGGLGISVRMTGYVLGIAAITGIFMTVVAFPPLHSRLGTSTFLFLCLACYLACTLLFPVMYSSHFGSARDALSGGSMLVMAAHFILRRIGDFSGTLLDALVLESLPSPDHLGMANAIVFSTRQLSRAIGLYWIAFLFSISAKADLGSWGRQMWWVLFGIAQGPGMWLVLKRRYR